MATRKRKRKRKNEGTEWHLPHGYKVRKGKRKTLSMIKLKKKVCSKLI